MHIYIAAAIPSRDPRDQNYASRAPPAQPATISNVPYVCLPAQTPPSPKTLATHMYVSSSYFNSAPPHRHTPYSPYHPSIHYQ